MEKSSASCKQLQVKRIIVPIRFLAAAGVSLFAFSIASRAQPPPLKYESRQAILAIAYFMESAVNSANSLNSLLKKDNYRNKITTLNNPTNNELGFSLKNEILAALKPLLDKARKTDHRKFKEVIENFLANPEENGVGSIKKYLPALGIFSTVLSLVGNLVIAEKNITREDLNQFIVKIQQYFSQYEKLNSINEQFGLQLNKLVERSEDTREELKDFIVDCVCTLNPTVSRQTAKDASLELLVRKYYDPQKLQTRLDTFNLKFPAILYPPDAPTSIKMITSGIRKLHKEFENLYSENYKQLKDLMLSLKTTIPGLDHEQLLKTNLEIDRLYKESQQADLVNLNLHQVEERMNTACSIINNNR